MTEMKMILTGYDPSFGLSLRLSKGEAAAPPAAKIPSFDKLRMRTLALAFAATALAAPAQAELFIDLRGGNFQPMPIAVADCVGETPQRPAPKSSS
jgi:hypothetical protein